MGRISDALTRRSQDLPDEYDERRLHQSQVVLKKENLAPDLQLSSTVISTEAADNYLDELFANGYKHDPLPQNCLDLIRKGERHSSRISLVECAEVNGRLTYRGMLYMPDSDPLKLRILRN